MSADAKIWHDGARWCGIHDLGDATLRDYSLSKLLQEIEKRENNRTEMRWELRAYPDGQLGLVGWCV